MPVLVHAAHRPLAQRLAGLLLAEGGQVRATAATGVAALRAAGVFTASCDPDDEGTLEAALTNVHTLVVLLGGIGSDDVAAVRAEGLAAARAAEGADIARAVLVTLCGSTPAASDPLRRVHAEVAAAFAALPLPTVEVRTGLVDTPALRALLRTAGLGAAERELEVAPVTAEALLHLVVAIDAARSRASEGHLVLAADGPRRVRIGELAATDGGPRTGMRLPAADARTLLLQVLQGPWRDEDPTILDAWALFGVAADRDDADRDGTDDPGGPGA